VNFVPRVRGGRARGVLATLLLALALVPAVPACRHASSDLPTLDAPVVLFFGDSLTRGQGVSEEEAFPSLLQRKLNDEGLDVRCINGGVSGDTTANALARIEPYAKARPSVVVVELGANDAFRRINRVQTQRNLLQIVNRFRDAGARVVVTRTIFPQLEHPAYMLSMNRMVEAVATDTGATYVPDLLAGVAGIADLNLPDGIHPNAAGHRQVAETVWPAVHAAVVAAGSPTK
jgi:acyl-CoA thioesterase-1